MKLTEIKDVNAQSDLPGWIAVPRGSIWQKDIKGCWVFDTDAEAYVASHSAKARRIVGKSLGYMWQGVTLNNVPLMLHLNSEGFEALRDIRYQIYAYGISEKSCRAAARKVMDEHGIEYKTDWDRGDSIWCYKTWNGDASYFDGGDPEDEDE